MHQTLFRDKGYQYLAIQLHSLKLLLSVYNPYCKLWRCFYVLSSLLNMTVWKELFLKLSVDNWTIPSGTLK